jgi:hypothetical protein
MSGINGQAPGRDRVRYGLLLRSMLLSLPHSKFAVTFQARTVLVTSAMSGIRGKAPSLDRALIEPGRGCCAASCWTLALLHLSKQRQCAQLLSGVVLVISVVNCSAPLAS